MHNRMIVDELRKLACSVGGSEGWGHLDTANTISRLDSNSDVALISPGSSPRVLDDPVVLSVFRTVSDSEDGVIESSAAVGVVEDTVTVHLEAELVSFDENGEWLLGKTGLHLVDIACGHTVALADCDGSVRERIVFASWNLASAGDVWVDRLKISISCVLVISVSPVRISTIAAHVELGSARDELLFGERFQSSSGDEVSTFEDTSGGERPARSALSLILNWGDTTKSSPVNGSWSISSIEIKDS